VSVFKLLFIMPIPVTGNNSTSKLYLTHMRITADKYRMFLELQIIIVGHDYYVFVIKHVPINMGPILNGYCAMGAF